MKVNYIVRITTHCVDGTFTTKKLNFYNNLEAARAYAEAAKQQPLKLCDVRRVVRRITLPVED